MTENCFGRGTAQAIATLTLLSTFFFVSAANALSIDFEQFAHGEVVIGTFDGVTIGADNVNRTFDYAVAFDSDETGTSDLDLEAGGAMAWSGGNLAGMQLGKMLILQENNAGCDTGICSDPDDEGRRPAGVFSIDLSIAITDFGFDAVDIESLALENAMITFFDGLASLSVDLMDFFDDTSSIYDPSLELGNNTANRFAPITAASLGLEQFDRIEFNLGGSGALDNLVGTPVPEPSTALLMCLGLGVMAASRQRRAV
jgi:hypothetical protein